MQNSNINPFVINGQTIDIFGSISKYTTHMMSEFGEIKKAVEAVYITNLQKFVNIGNDAQAIADYHEKIVKPLKVISHTVTVGDGDDKKEFIFDLVNVRDFWRCLKVLNLSPAAYEQMSKYMSVAKNSEYILGLSDDNKKLLSKVSDAAVVANAEGGIEEWKKEKAQKAKERAEKAAMPRRSDIEFGDVKKNPMKSVLVKYYLTPESNEGFTSPDAVEKYLLNKLFSMHGLTALSATNRKEILTQVKAK